MKTGAAQEHGFTSASAKNRSKGTQLLNRYERLILQQRVTLNSVFFGRTNPNYYRQGGRKNPKRTLVIDYRTRLNGYNVVPNPNSIRLLHISD